MSYGDYSHRETPPSNNVGGGSAPKEPQESKVSKFFSSVKSFFSFGSGSSSALENYDFVDQTKTTESPPAPAAKTNATAKTVLPTRQRELSNALSNTAPARPKPQTASSQTPHANTSTAPATPKQQTAPAQTPQTSAQSTSASSTQQAAQSSEAPMSNEEKANKIIAKFEQKYAKNFIESESTDIQAQKKMDDDKLDYCAHIFKFTDNYVGVRVYSRLGNGIICDEKTFPLKGSLDDIEKKIENYLLNKFENSLRLQKNASAQQAEPQQTASIQQAAPSSVESASPGALWMKQAEDIAKSYSIGKLSEKDAKNKFEETRDNSPEKQLAMFFVDEGNNTLRFISPTGFPEMLTDAYVAIATSRFAKQIITKDGLIDISHESAPVPLLSELISKSPQKSENVDQAISALKEKYKGNFVENGASSQQIKDKLVTDKLDYVVQFKKNSEDSVTMRVNYLKNNQLATDGFEASILPVEGKATFNILGFFENMLDRFKGPSR